MLSNRLAFAALAVACIGAAAGGGYLASRQNAVPAPASAQVQPQPAAAPASTTALAPAAEAPRPVQETEAIVAETARTASPKSAPAKRVEPPARPAPTRQARAQSPRQDPPPLANTWPASASQQQPPAPPAPPAPPDAQQPPRDERQAVEPQRAPEPPQHTLEELVVSAQTVIGLATETRLSSETARVEDRVDARVTRDVRAGDRVAIPAGAHAIGSVMQVERGGKFKERARLAVRFHTIVLADGTRIPISTDTISREGESPSNSSAAKMGGAAVGGAILGAILGGAKGAAIGAGAGAAGGTAAVMAGDRQAAVLPAGTPMTVRVLQPVTVTIDKN